MSADGLQAVDLLFGILQPGEVFANPHGLTPFNSTTVHGYFEDHRGWSGTDFWAVALTGLPTYIKPPADRASQAGDYPRLFSLIGKASDPHHQWADLIVPLIETEGPAAEVFTDHGIEVTHQVFIDTVEQLIIEANGTKGSWLYSGQDRVLVYQLPVEEAWPAAHRGPGALRPVIGGLIKIN